MVELTKEKVESGEKRRRRRDFVLRNKARRKKKFLEKLMMIFFNSLSLENTSRNMTYTKSIILVLFTESRIGIGRIRWGEF